METIRVVLADDHTLFREGTRQLLERDSSIRVVGEAAEGAAAVALVDELEPDVAIIDIEMPELDGIEATRRIKAAHPGVGVLVLTVHDEDPFVFAILDAGAAGYLLKDVSSSELVRAVHALQAGESVLHPAIARKVLSRVRSERTDEGSRLELPERDVRVLRLAAQGRTNREIADELGVSTRTIQLRLSNVFDSLGVGSRTEAVIAGLRAGLFDLEEVSP
ncbi:MAG: response regulator transcription factor [Nitriliruptorales bacterium]|nr:response regulator transcription factor [Nitriliruptorales bacterium]